MPRSGDFSRVVASLTCLALAGAPLEGSLRASAAPVPVTTLASSLRAIQDGENAAPRDHWDPAFVAAALGNDPVRTFAWTRSRTYWIPYQGILRGATGVLMDRQGDSLDRAVLLATLFAGEHQTVRLAHGTIPADQATRLLPRLLRARIASFVPTARATSADPWAAVAAQYQLDEASLRKTLKNQSDSVARQRVALRARLADQSRRLAAAVGKAPADSAHANLAHAVAALSDHWWVQTQQGATWRDWDLLGGATGAALVKSDRTVDPASIPADLFHQITIRVVTERWLNGVTSEKVILEHSLRPSAVMGTPISLDFSPDASPKTFPLPGMNAEQSLRKSTLDQHEWTPVLTIGTEHVIQNAITDAGDITVPTNQSDVLAVARGVTHGLGAAIADVFGDPAPAPAAPAVPATASGQFLTAAWLEYEIDSPGVASQTIRRDVFDLLGPAARAAKVTTPPVIDDAARLTRGFALSMATDILPVNCDLSPQYVNHLSAQSVLANRSVLTDVVAGNVGNDYAAAESLGGRLAPVPSSLYRLALTRFDLNPLKASFYIDRPDILTRHLLFAQQGNALGLETATDIVADGIGVDPIEPAPFAVRLAQGVFDTNAEAVLASERPDAAAVAWAFDGAKDWVTLTSAADPRLAALQLSPDVRQRIRASLASGHVVVAPRAPVNVAGGSFSGWWQIDKTTGETLGMGERGWGQDLPEFVVVMMASAAQGFVLGYMMCLLAGGSNCAQAGLISGVISGLTAGLGLGIGMVAGPAASAGEGGLAGALAADEGGLSPLAQSMEGEAGGAGAAGEGGAGGAGGGGSGGGGSGGAGGPGGAGGGPGGGPGGGGYQGMGPNDPGAAGMRDAGYKWVEDLGWRPDSDTPDMLDALRKSDQAQGNGDVQGAIDHLHDYFDQQGSGRFSPDGSSGGGVEPPGGEVPGGAPTSPLATTGGGPAGGPTSPLATTGGGPSGGSATIPQGGSPTIPQGGSATPSGGSPTIPQGNSPTIPGGPCVGAGCISPAATTLGGIGGALNALGG